jgi:hypothetical protein
MPKTTFRNQIISLSGALLFFLGVVLALMLAVIAIWADYEAIFYGFDLFGNERLPEMDCPVLVTPNQPGLVTVNFTNPLDKDISLVVRANFSNPGPLQQKEMTLPLAVGESRKVSWPVTGEQVDLRFFIFAQVSHLPTATIRYRQSICGMTMIHVPFLSGDQLFVLWFFVAIGSLIGGFFLWCANGQPIEGKRLTFYNYMRFLGTVALLALLAGMEAWWAPGILLLALCLVVMSAMLAWKLLP